MRYISTRGRAPELGFCDALLAGLATDGGLYVPQTWPTVNAATTGSYADRAAAIMQPFIGAEIDTAVVPITADGGVSPPWHAIHSREVRPCEG